MTAQTLVLPPLVPENAPFSTEQRAWLNGFFAGLLSMDGGMQALSRDAATALLGSPLPGEAAPAEEDDGAPWHDASLPIDERMELAAGRPVKRRMFAAMAQQDCGQCGYLCESYSAAIATGEEKKLNLCVPGGKETTRMLKKLYEELDGGAAPAKPAAAPAPATPVAVEPGRSRETPVEAAFLSKHAVSGEGSDKETNHVEIDLSGCGLTYEPGDSFGLFATNAPELCAAVAARLGVAEDVAVSHDGHTLPLKTWLSERVALGAAPDALFELLAAHVESSDDKQTLAKLAEGEDPDGDLATLDVLAALEKFPAATPPVAELLGALDPLQPRLYSISSALSADPGKVSLTVAAVRYRIGDRTRLGLASTYLSDRVAPGDRLKVYVQKAHGFALPKDGAVPIVMVGPGTGIAPFRSFLRERKATHAAGGAWLFYGHQHEATDYYYRDEIADLQAAGALTRLSLAWSRDGAEKVYVQDRMRESGAELWSWLEKGAHFYVCGDAKRMAADVEKALVEVVAAHGAKTADEAKAFVAGLKKAGRYQADVY
ncbi:sulfite reductase (NADPH) flavoprotein alpha-component [Methylopila capsulata]|uniref:assimilatory sulfite reductase (NADPH) n=1 Tax=Methylopila capsulata TaxID=61654 RepID=A0A9W6MTR8_9HYPH|nr:sulfite reductase subunit alpha [Methylopila capsulata]MBM7853114.1 sulfite reductase (NADPH) flavoprotein alpha-component [Methylopila capsulata]GLK57673.1 sulfite reductase [Methylopila capsulata]